MLQNSGRCQNCSRGVASQAILALTLGNGDIFPKGEVDWEKMPNLQTANRLKTVKGRGILECFCLSPPNSPVLLLQKFKQGQRQYIAKPALSRWITKLHLYKLRFHFIGCLEALRRCGINLENEFVWVCMHAAKNLKQSVLHKE